MKGRGKSINFLTFMSAVDLKLFFTLFICLFESDSFSSFLIRWVEIFLNFLLMFPLRGWVLIIVFIRRVAGSEAKEGGKKVYHDEPQRKPGHHSSSQSSSSRDTNGSSSKERVNRTFNTFNTLLGQLTVKCALCSM